MRGRTRVAASGMHRVLALQFQVQLRSVARSSASRTATRGETTGPRDGEQLKARASGFGPANEGVVMKKLGIALAITIAAAGAAHAADLPTTKPPPPPPENCFSSLWAYLNSTAADCPLTYGPFTAYLTLDWGFGWESHGAGYNAAYNNGVSNIVTKQSGPQIRVAADAQRDQSVGRRHQDEPADRLWMVDRRHGGNGIQSVLGLSGRRSALASSEQRQGAHSAGRKRRFRAALVSGTTRRGFSASATRSMARSLPAA